MIWDTIGMMQVSKNNWNLNDKSKEIDLGQVVLKDIFETKYKPLLDKPKYNISLLSIKKLYESNINKENELEALGFDLNELKALLQEDFDLSDKQQKWLDKIMSYKPSQLTPNEKDSDKQKEYKFKCVKFLNTIKLPLSEIVLKTSGGHPGITNLNGFGFLQEQKRNNYKISNGINPYSTEEVPKKDNDKPFDKSTYESTSLKILKSIAEDVVKYLNGQKITESVEDIDDDIKIGDKFLWKGKSANPSGTIVTCTETRKYLSFFGYEPKIAYVLDSDDELKLILFMSDIKRFIDTGYLKPISSNIKTGGEEYDYFY